MKKKLNVDAVMNELREGSVFFQHQPPNQTAAEQAPPSATNPAPSPLDVIPPLRPATASLSERRSVPMTLQPGTPEPAAPGQVSAEPVFDLSREADKTNTYSFSKDELWAITDMVQELERTFDIKVTRYNLVRLAVHALIEDFRRDREKSFILRRLHHSKK